MISQCSQTYGILILNQTLIITRQGNHEQQTLNTLKAVDPLLPFRPLPTDIHHAEVHLSELEQRLRNTRCPKSSLQHVLIVGQPARRKYAVQSVVKAGRHGQKEYFRKCQRTY